MATNNTRRELIVWRNNKTKQNIMWEITTQSKTRNGPIKTHHTTKIEADTMCD
jgi:hypothetical protein